MFLYFLKVTICWLVFYLVYSNFLSNETFFKTNRWYLLGTLLLGAGIPLLEFLPIFQEDNPVVIYFQPISEGSFYVQSAVNEVVANTFFDWENFFIGLYLIGVAIFSIRFFIGLGKIYALYQKSEIIKKENHTLVLTNQPHLPFSFFKYMFWSKDLEVNDVDGQKIVTHEEAHVKGWHSIDVILLEIFSIIFWVSPMVYFYKRSLKTVHEYLADAVVLQTTPTKNYGHLLLRQSQSGLQIALANHFFHSQLKQRIVMMTRSKSRKEAIVKYLFAIPVILLLLIAFSKKEAIANIKNTATEIVSSQDFDREKVKSEFEILVKKYQDTSFDLKENQDEFLGEHLRILFSLNRQYPEYSSEIDEIERSVLAESNLPLITHFPRVVAFKHKPKDAEVSNGDVDEMPRFSGCEDKTKISDRNACSKNKLFTFLYSNVKYPKVASKAGIEGKVIISFLVKKDGTIGNAKIKKDIGGGCGEEALRVINTMPNWIPGMKDGKAVDVEMALPVSFKLASDEVYKVVEEMPRFKNEDCEKMNDSKDQKKCAEMAMLKFIYSNIKYPKVARNAGIQGTVIIKFTVQKDGSIADAKVLRDPGGGCGEEAERVVNMMPNFVPGKQKGEAVNVSYTLPVSFKLSGPNPKTAIKDNEKFIKITSDMKPLFIVDGVEFDKAAAGELKPDQIETVQVLKGEKATEKYGDKGKNGVVEITMKKESSTKVGIKTHPTKKNSTLKEAGLTYVKISPNPTNGKIDIEYGSQDKPMTIVVSDINGKEIFSKKVVGGRSSLQNVDVSKAAKGMLLVSFFQDGKTYTEKVILQ